MLLVLSVSRKQSSNKSLKRLSSSKKKSSDIGVISEEKMEEEEVPEQLPSYEDAFSLFMINDNYKYEELQKNIQLEEMNLKEVHKNYLNEVNKFQEANNVFKIIKEELFQV